MKQKLYYLLGLVGAICLNQQTGYALQPNVQTPVSVKDTTSRFQKVTIKVKDLGSSKLLDSVRVSLGKEVRFTTKGIAVFENSNDSIILLTKPGYNRVAKKIAQASVSINMMKTDEALDGFFVNPSLSQKAKAVFSNSATVITGDDLRKVSSLSLIEGLRFYVPSLYIVNSNNNGSNPNAAPQIRLRGTSNLPFSATVVNNNNASSGVEINPSAADYVASNVLLTSSPLILLDGIQVSVQTIQDIDLNRISSVTVLKDAVATASYGMRGGNGVIAIQTLKPQGKFDISFSEQLQITQAKTASYKLLTAQQKVDIEKQSGLFNGALAPIYQSRYNQAYNNNVNTNWLEVPLETGVGAKHSLALNAGNDDVMYGLNASYNDVKGTMKGSGRQTIDLGAYFGGRIGDITFNNQFAYLGNNASNSPYGTLDAYAKMNPYWSPLDPYTGKYQKIVELNTIGGTDVTFKNPAFNSTLSTLDASKYSRFSNLTNLNWIMGAGFRLNAMASIARQSDEVNYFLPPNHTVFADVTPDNLFKRGLYQYTSNTFMDVQGGLRLQYLNNFGKHQVFANVGQSIAQTSSESSGIEVAGFAVDRLADISFGNAYSIPKPISGKIVTRYLSTFGTFGYSYDNRYQVDVSGTLDYYSGISKAANYGGLGLTWNVSNESFLKPVQWINLLKIKGSYGVTGNQSFLSYLNKTTYNYYTNQQYIPAGSGTGTIGVGLGAFLTTYGNSNLKAPQTIKQDVGLDADLFNNRLSLNFSWFKQLNRQIILPTNTAASTGYQSFSYYDNFGKIENSGFEIGMLARVYQSDRNNFKINISANAFKASDKITALSPYLSNVNYNNNFNLSQTEIQPQYVLGYSPYAIWAVPSAGIDAQSGQEIFLKKDGSTTMVWDANDKVYAGNLTPTWMGSFGVDASYIQFSLAIYFNYQHGAKVYNQTMANIENANVNDNIDGRVLNDKRWTAGMPNASFKALFNSPTYATTRLVENDNMLQCSSIILGYALPRKIAEKIKAKNLGIKMMMNNAFELGGADMQRGIYYPFQRNYTVILNANF